MRVGRTDRGTPGPGGGLCRPAGIPDLVDPDGGLLRAAKASVEGIARSDHPPEYFGDRCHLTWESWGG